MKTIQCQAKNKDGKRCTCKAKYVQNKTGKKTCGRHATGLRLTFK